MTKKGSKDKANWLLDVAKVIYLKRRRSDMILLRPAPEYLLSDKSDFVDAFTG